MTALAKAARRPTLSLAGLRINAVVGALVVLVAAAALTIGLVSVRDTANATTVQIPPAKASALIQATAATTDVRAVGEQAKLINASMPFVGGPLHSARPFAVSGSDLDQRRALLCLTQAVYYEAGFEPVDGRRAVAQVVLNRMRHPAYPKSICGVVYQSSGRVCQFTFVCDGALYRAPARDAWSQSEAIARAALAGYVERRVGEATHYHADYVAPRWAPMLAKVAQIGQHIFYRWPGAWGQPGAFTGRYIGEPRDPLALRPPPPAIGTTTEAVVAQVAGPPIPRAPNDVGGLLDTSKGWTLTIPAPEESGGAASQLIAAQERKADAQERKTDVKVASAEAPKEVVGR